MTTERIIDPNNPRVMTTSKNSAFEYTIVIDPSISNNPIVRRSKK